MYGVDEGNSRNRERRRSEMNTVTTPALLQRFEEPLAIDTRSITKRYGNKTALSGLELTVPESAVYLLVGENGAGKTTALKLLLDLVRPNNGTTSVFGLDPARDGAMIRAGIGYVPEDRGPACGWMRVAKLLAYHAAHFSSWDNDYANHLIDALGADTTSRYKSLSKGEARRVQLVTALAHRPRLLLLDEPTDGLDPVSRDRFFALLADHLATSPTTILISSHLVYEQELFADHLGVIRNGTLTAQVDRDKLDHHMRRYVAETPEGGIGDAGLGDAIINQHSGTGGVDWVVWGDKTDVTAAMEGAGATVRHVKRLTLTEAARALMTADSSEPNIPSSEMENHDERKHG
jgi:ABC-2 type transport system ATP-binding protein